MLLCTHKWSNSVYTCCHSTDSTDTDRQGQQRWGNRWQDDLPLTTKLRAETLCYTSDVFGLKTTSFIGLLLRPRRVFGWPVSWLLSRQKKKNVLVKNSLKALGWVSVYTGTFTPAPTEPIWFRHRALALDGMWAPLRTSEDQAKCWNEIRNIM